MSTSQLFTEFGPDIISALSHYPFVLCKLTVSVFLSLSLSHTNMTRDYTPTNTYAHAQEGEVLCDWCKPEVFEVVTVTSPERLRSE